jgi:Ala-tRNA(Pro) deacylase
MSIAPKIKSYLEKEKVPFESLEHSPAYSAMEIAGAQHVPGRQMIKTVLVKAGDLFILFVLPAIHYVDLEKLKNHLKVNDIEIAKEEEIAKLFPEYEVGAAPPFGHLYGLKVFADKIMEEDDEIVFNAGTHTNMIRMKLADFKRLVNPIFVDFGVHIHTYRNKFKN